MRDTYAKPAVLAWAMTVVVCVIGLFLTRPPFRAENGFTILLGLHAEYLPFLPLLLLAPIIARTRRIVEPIRDVANRIAALAKVAPSVDITSVVLIATAATWATSHLAAQFDAITPTYHDEFSYLFQARTFLRGELSAPGFPEQPGLFDQMHVVSGERMSSRYFPGTAVWMMPFVAIGRPWLGHQVAHVLCSVLIYACGRTLNGRVAGTIAGGLFALSPGLVLFSNLLLAHHPTLVGLLVFLLTYLNWIKDRRARWLAIAGTGLAFAMLCRPMTAAGFGLPFGMHFIATCARNLSKSKAIFFDVASIGLPLLIGFIAMGVFNSSVTSDPLLSPYEVYNDIHTPRHIYGFENGTKGDSAVEDADFDPTRRMTSYDEWAVNLTPAVAVTNVGKRIESSLRLTLGVIPLTLVAGFWLASVRTRPVGEKLIGASIASLHLVHVPYWFSGIMDWHYVMESSVCWLLLTGVVTKDFFTLAYRREIDPIGVLWAATLVGSATLNQTSALPYYVSECQRAASEVDFARTRYQGFFNNVQQAVGDRPSIVFVRPDPFTPQIDYVVNEPGLTSQTLYARLRPSDQLNRAAARFPDRDVYVFDVAANRFDLIRNKRQ